MSSTDTFVNGIADSGVFNGVVIFDTREGNSNRVFIHWDDDHIRRQLLYSLMTTEEVELWNRGVIGRE